MSCQELQEEEVEVLRSIYEGDSHFKEINSTTYQYKIGDDGSYKSFLVEVSWGPDYPEQLPAINLDAFYNNHMRCFEVVNPCKCKSMMFISVSERINCGEVEKGVNFYLKHFTRRHNRLASVKESTVEKLKKEVADFLGSAMTFSIFEFAKEHAVELMAEQPDAPPQASERDTTGSSHVTQDPAKVKVKKEQLTKAQKRKMYSRLDNKGEMPRGYNWVDIIRHLSQTGGGQPS